MPGLEMAKTKPNGPAVKPRGSDYVRKTETRINRQIGDVKRKAEAMLEQSKIKPMTVTPQIAMQLLEHNGNNRPLSDQHVHRIARQIAEDKWKFNGDTIKVASTGDVLDGQHRLWACIEAKKPIETIVVRGIEPDAFATIDTLRKPRNGADVLALNGATFHRPATAMALTWLLRWQSGSLLEYRAPQNRIENSDVEEAYRAHPGMVDAVTRAQKLRAIANPAVLAFLFYVFANRDGEIAERMMTTLEDPAAVSINDPFFRLRSYFTTDHHRRKEPIMTIALAFKAANAVKEGKKISTLSWRVQGKSPEPFPDLMI